MLIIQFTCKSSEIGRVRDVSDELVGRLLVWKVEVAHDSIVATFLEHSRVLEAELLRHCDDPSRVRVRSGRILELWF